MFVYIINETSIWIIKETSLNETYGNVLTKRIILNAYAMIGISALQVENLQYLLVFLVVCCVTRYVLKNVT